MGFLSLRGWSDSFENSREGHVELFIITIGVKWKCSGFSALAGWSDRSFENSREGHGEMSRLSSR